MSQVAALSAACAVLVGLRAAVGPLALAPSGRGRIGDRVGRGMPEPPRWFARMAASADLSPIEVWWAAGLASTAMVSVVGGALGGAPLAALAGVVAAAVAVSGLRALRHRRDARVVRSVPDALDAVARSCRAGASVVQALGDLDGDDALPAGRLLAEAARRVERGQALREALDEVVGRHPLPALRLTAAALLVGADTGAAPARAVEGVATTLRDHAALEREAAAHATQAQASAAVLVLAPVGFGVMAIATDPRVGEFLFRTPGGLLCLGAGVALDVSGAWWMSRMVRSVR